MKKILHIINNDTDGIALFVKKLIKLSLNDHQNIIVSKYSKNKNQYLSETGKSLKEFFYQPSLIFNNFKEFSFKLFNKLKRDTFNLYYKPNTLFNFFFNKINISELKKKIKNTDIIIIYTFREIISPKNLNEIIEIFNCKVYLYPLDNELLSGGFHFENLSEKNLKLEKKNIQLLEYKKKYLSNLKISWIGGNKYISRKIKTSKLFNAKLHKNFRIYNTIEKYNFSKYEIINFKIKKNLNNFDLILLYTGIKLSDKRKGIEDLKKCIYQISKFSKKNYKIALVTVGNNPELEIHSKFIKHIHFNFINDFKKLSLLFSSCDIFLNLSKSDFGPVLCEIAFVNELFILSTNVGIAKEIVVNHKNGYIYQNEKDLIKKFEMIIDLSIKKLKPEKNNQILFMKKNYKKNKKYQFNKIFNE